MTNLSEQALLSLFSKRQMCTRNVKLLIPQPKKIKGIFFDDSTRNLQNLDQIDVEGAFVDSQKPNFILDHPKENYLSKYKSLCSKTQLEILERIYRKNKSMLQHPNCRISNGITMYDHIIYLLDEILENIKYKTHTVVFFDFDLTISCRQGLYLTNLLQHKQVHQYIKYILGGRKRLQMLKDLFILLRKLGCDVYILTNNNGAKENRDIFLSYLQIIDPHFEEEYLYASGMTYPPLDETNNKKHYLKIHMTDWKLKKNPVLPTLRIASQLINTFKSKY
jgi:hypothetical protein